jgi:hypothetical protein
MLQPHELRIGNWILLKAETLSGNVSEFAKVIELGEDYVRTAISSVSQLPAAENIYGIELTPDLLEKIDFKKLQDNNFSFRGVVFHETDEKKVFYAYKDGNSEMKYVHQLQNLYFALTGEELPVIL